MASTTTTPLPTSIHWTDLKCQVRFFTTDQILTNTSLLFKGQYTYANRMSVCVNETANMRCTICEWFAYHSPQTKLCRFFAQTQRELCTLCVLCSPQICRKLIYQVPIANCLQTIWFTCVYRPIFRSCNVCYFNRNEWKTNTQPKW